MKGLIFVVVTLLTAVYVYAEDEPFMQDISFRSYFGETKERVSTSWEKLPFSLSPDDMTKKGKFLFAEDKILMLNKGILYCSSKKEIEPPMESLGNKYNEWKQLGDLGLNEANIMVKSFTNSTSKISVYTLTSNNIAHIEFESGCDKFAITNYILSDDELFEWGKVNAFEYAQSLQTLFIATKNNF